MDSQMIFQIQSSLILVLLFVGLYFKRDRARHVKIMYTAIAWDILLVLQIEFTRSAIAKASKVIQNTAILNIHVALALTTVVLYFGLIYLGRKMLRGEHVNRALHKNLGLMTVLLRILVFVTSFFTVTKEIV